MVSVLGSFAYIGITAWFLGFGVKLFVQHFFHYEMLQVTGILYAGLGMATVYAGIYSLLGGISLGANIGMLIICLGIGWFGKKEMAAFYQRKKAEMTKTKLAVVLFFVLLFSYGASRGYLHFDSGLYHAQAIRWIEEYGVVPGLANLHSRLGYNSSAFILTALYSLKFLTGQSLHTVAGFMALVLCVKGLDVVEVFGRKKVLASDFLKVAVLFYISIIYTEMMSPASDYFAMLFLFYIILTWVELEEKGEKDITPYGLLCVLLAVNVTIKLSVAIMLLLVLKPAWVLLKEKRYREIGIYLCLGILAVFPYLARNVILSGWLVYPFPAIDLFSFDWKIPAGEAAYDGEEIKVYAKGMTDVLLKDTPVTQWLPGWFQSLKGLEKIWVLSSFFSVAGGSLVSVLSLAQRKKERYGILFVEVVLLFGYLFWQLGTPLVRYGYLYILAFPFLTLGIWYVFLLGKNKKSYLWFSLFLIVFFSYKGIRLAEDVKGTMYQKYYLWQRDYETWEYDSYEVDGIKLYVPLESGQIGYEKFPAAPYERYDIELRGTGIKDGFRRKMANFYDER